MSLFSNMQHKQDVEKPKDSLGGGGFVKESGVYLAVIELAYASESADGAKIVNLEFKLKDGSTYKERFYVTDNDGNHVAEKDGSQYYVKGFVQVDDLCALATEKYLNQQTIEDKLIKFYEYPTGEVEREMPCLVELRGKKVYLAIQKVKAFKRAQEGGKWVDTAEIKESNNIMKIANVDRFTVAELMEQKEEPEFMDKWEEKNKDVTWDKTKGKTPKGSGQGSPKSGGLASSAPRKSLLQR